MNKLKDLTPKKIKNMSLAELTSLASDIRSFLIETINLTGGHLSPNLGVVELTIALHYVFDSPNDQIIFDIGHQAYTHKILTERAEGFHKLRQKDGVSGFTSYEESAHDVWESGHAGTALSALMGVLYSNKIDKVNNHAVAVIGDGALSSGMSLEALNLISYHHLPGIIVINNNKMSISKSVGKISEILNGDYQTKHAFFEKLGYNFLEVNDGHDLNNLIETFKQAKEEQKPVIILVNTIKGKGFKKAEADQVGTYHMISSKKSKLPTWSQVVSQLILDIQEEIPTMVVVPAMEVGSHLSDFRKAYPKRYLDVGISEEHAATMAAALAKNNKNVILSLYSTFSQRAFDQILNDIARPSLGVFITIDRAGLIAGDGDTHQGIYDVSMFNLMPNTYIASPSNIQEAADLIRFGLKLNKPFIMRYPKGLVSEKTNYTKRDITHGWNQVLSGSDLNIIASGPLVNKIKNLAITNNLSINLYNALFVKPIDYQMLSKVFKNEKPILVIEENINVGSLYPEILRYKEAMNYESKVIDHSLNDLLIPHLNELELYEFASFDDESLVQLIKHAIR